MRLSEYPYVSVRLACSLCPRKGQYRLARLAAKFGPEADLQEVVWRLSADCPYQRDRWDRPPRKYEARCNARVQDIDETREKPADMAPADRRARLKPIDGGKI